MRGQELAWWFVRPNGEYTHSSMLARGNGKFGLISYSQAQILALCGK